MTEAGVLTHYEWLGVGPEASLDEVKAAYGRKLHQFRARLASDNPYPPEHLDALRAAYVTLGEPDKRREYDASLGEAGPAPTVEAEESPRSSSLADAVPMVITDPYPTVVEDLSSPRAARFEFLGQGGEYFRIWIVNLCLSILTLGIYSAWAKVRREQYFHRNLLVDGSPFDYHGQPRSILKGRAVAFILLMGLSIAQKSGPAIYGLALLALTPLVPWLVVKALRFRAYNTSYRGLRFSFHGTYRQAVSVFIGYGLLTLITLGLAYPLWYRQLRKFVLDNTRFASTPLTCSVTIGAIYRAFIVPMVTMVLLFVAFAVVGAMMAQGAATKSKEAMLVVGVVVMVLVPLAFILMQAVVLPYVAVRTGNAVWSATRLGPHALECRMPVGGYIGTVLVNWLATLATLGVFTPWAKVRLAQFRAEYLTLHVQGNLDAFVASESLAVSALGDETAEMFDLDFGF